MSVVRLERVYFQPHDLEHVEDMACQRLEVSRAHPTHQAAIDPLHAQRVGYLGELTVARMIGLAVMRAAVFGPEDFPDTNVKATSSRDRGLLVKEALADGRVGWYVLVYVGAVFGEVLGHCSLDHLRAHGSRTTTKLGRCLHLSVADLVPSLPDHLWRLS